MYFVVNVVTESKQVAVFLTAIGGEMYILLTSLLSPVKPHEKTSVKAHLGPCR